MSTKEKVREDTKMKGRVGVIKSVDMLGRVVIPKELRERFALGDNVEIVATEEGIMIRNPEYKIVKEENDAIKEKYKIK